MNKFLLIAFSVLAISAAGYLLYISKPQLNKIEIHSPTPTTSASINSLPCDGVPTISQTEGPYYKSGSPQKQDLSENMLGEKLTITGYVFDKSCRPIPNAWLDFWQADSQGNYDMSGYNLRGHQFTDANGRYELQTVMPAEYGSRPPHIHLKVREGNGPILTSQIYFPEAPQNQADNIFDPTLIMQFNNVDGYKKGMFNFVLDI
jgi:protocatechuate 3,4-dioxygenase beta subunit